MWLFPNYFGISYYYYCTHKASTWLCPTHNSFNANQKEMFAKCWSNRHVLPTVLTTEQQRIPKTLAIHYIAALNRA